MATMRRRARGSVLGTAVLFVTGFVLFVLGFSQVSMFMPVAGLLQRLTIIVGWVWLSAFAWFLLHETPAERPYL